MDSKMFLDAIAALPVDPVKISSTKHYYRKHEPTGAKATPAMLRLLAYRLMKKGVKVSALPINSALNLEVK